MNRATTGVNKAIRVNLTRNEMTQKDLAEKTGMKLGYLNVRLNGHRSWSIDELDAIADALGTGRALDLLKLADEEESSQELAA